MFKLVAANNDYSSQYVLVDTDNNIWSFTKLKSSTGNSEYDPKKPVKMPSGFDEDIIKIVIENRLVAFLTDKGNMYFYGNNRNKNLDKESIDGITNTQITTPIFYKRLGGMVLDFDTDGQNIIYKVDATKIGHDKKGYFYNGEIFDKIFGKYFGFIEADIDKVALQNGGVCILFSDGHVEVAGNNKGGRLGVGSDEEFIDKLTEPILPDGTKIVDIGFSSRVMYLVDSEGNVWAAGKTNHLDELNECIQLEINR